MATILRTFSAVPSMGLFTASTGTGVECLSAVGGGFVSSGAATTSLYGNWSNPSGSISNPVNSVTVRATARLAAASGQRDFVAGLRVGVSATAKYHPNPIVVTSDAWTVYEFTFTENPETLTAWDTTAISILDRIYLRCTTINGTQDLQIDYAEVEVDYGGDGASYSATINDGFLVATDTTSISFGMSPRPNDRVNITDVSVNQEIQVSELFSDSMELTDSVMVMGGPVRNETQGDTSGLTDGVTFKLTPQVAFDAINYGADEIERIYLGTNLIWTL